MWSTAAFLLIGEFYLQAGGKYQSVSASPTQLVNKQNTALVDRGVSDAFVKLTRPSFWNPLTVVCIVKNNGLITIGFCFH